MGRVYDYGAGGIYILKIESGNIIEQHKILKID
jgi:hypothetical protein